MKWIILYVIISCDYSTNICKKGAEPLVIKAKDVIIHKSVNVVYDSEKDWTYSKCQISVNGLIRITSESCRDVVKTVNEGL